MKRYTTLLSIKECKLKLDETPLHMYIPIKMAKIKVTDDSTGEDSEQLDLYIICGNAKRYS